MTQGITETTIHDAPDMSKTSYVHESHTNPTCGWCHAATAIAHGILMCSTADEVTIFLFNTAHIYDSTSLHANAEAHRLEFVVRPKCKEIGAFAVASVFGTHMTGTFGMTKFWEIRS